MSQEGEACQPPSFFLVQIFWLKLLLIATAGAVTLYLLHLPTAAPAGKGQDTPT